MGNVLTGLVAGTVITASALTNVEVAENTLKALLQEKQEFIEKTEQVTKEVRTIVDRYDLDKKEGSIEKIEASRNDLQEHIAKLNDQISIAERVLGEEKAKELQAEEKAEQAEESKEDKVEIKTTDYVKKEDKNKKTITIPTGVEGVNLIVPITITMATLGGITGYSIYSKRRRKARK